MKYNITLLQDIGRMLMTGILYFVAFFTIFSIYEKDPISPAWFFGIPLVLVVNWSIERYCYHFVPYYLLHGLVFVPLFIITFPCKTLLYLYCMMLILEFFSAVFYWSRHTRKPYEDVPFAIFLILILLHGLATLYHFDTLCTVLYYSGIALLAIHFLRLYLNGAGNMLAKASYSSSSPTKKMFVSGSILSGFIVLVFFITIFFLQSLGMKKIAATLSDFLIQATHFILLFLNYIINIIHVLFAKESEIPSESTEEALTEQLFAQTTEPSAFAQFLNRFLLLFCCAIALYFLYQLCKRILHALAKHYMQETDFVVTITDRNKPIKKKKESITLTRQFHNLFHSDNATKIRQLYKKKIKSYPEALYKNSDTPTELADRIVLHYKEDITELTGLYVKARYSNEPITQADVTNATDM